MRHYILYLVLLLIPACATKMKLADTLPLITPEIANTPTSPPPPTTTTIPPTLTPQVTKYPTITPTYTPWPLRYPYIRPASADYMPPIKRDLLFLENGQPKIWERGGKIVPLMAQGKISITNVTWFSVSADNQKIMLLRDTTTKTQELFWFDRQTFKVTPILTETPPLLFVAISPNEQWVAYMPDNSPPSADLKARQITPPRRVASLGVKISTIYAKEINTSHQPLEIGFSTQIDHIVLGDILPCTNIINWSPDNHTIMWSDAHGIWQTKLDQPEIHLLLTNPNEKIFSAPAVQTWSPSGQYSLNRVCAYDANSWSSILDIKQGNSINVPASNFNPYGVSVVTWLPNDRLLLLRSSDIKFGYYRNQSPKEHPPIVGEIWRIEALSKTLSLQREAWFPLPGSPENIPTAPVLFEDGRLGFALQNNDAENDLERGLYIVDPTTLVAQKVNGLPPFRQTYYNNLFDIIWSKDGSGAIIHRVFKDKYDSNDSFLYIPTDNTAVYNLRPIISDEAYGFTWLK